MKKYTIDLVKRITLSGIEAINGSDAAIIAKQKMEDIKQSSFDVENIVDEETDEVLMICEVCDGDIHPGDKYTTAEDDGYNVCEKCSKEAMETNG